MAQKSWFFNSAPGDPRIYQASDFAQYFGKVLSTGLLHIDEVPGLQVKADGTDLRTYVEPGGAIMEGYAYENTDNEYLAHSLPEVSLDRIDRIVLRLDEKNANRYIRLFVVEGEPSTEPVAPTLQRDNLVWELSLAQVRIRANTSTINPSDVFDERLDRTVCGLVFSLISKPAMADIQTGGYAVTATVEGQTDFEIPLQSFDKVGDGLTVFVEGEKAAYSSYEVLYPRTVRFSIGVPIGTLVEFEIIRGVLTLEDGYVVTAGEVGIIDAGGYYESENVEGALQKIGQSLFSPKPKIYGISIDLDNQDPLTGVQRINDSTTFLSQAEFENVYPFNQIRPCVLKNGIVQYYLNPNDWTKKIDGTPSNITDFAPGDVMIEIPKVYWSITRDSNSIKVRISKEKIDESFVALAHSIGNSELNFLYISSYVATLDSDNKLRSISGKSAYQNASLLNYRTYARNNGNGYNAISYYQVLLIQVLYLIRFANRDSKNTIGSTTFNQTSGSRDSAGMNVLSPSTGIMKFLGLEQFLNNHLMKVEGAISVSGKFRVTNDPTKYSDVGEEYEILNGNISTIQGFIKDVLGNNKGAFLTVDNVGSSSTYYTDQAYMTGSGSYHFGFGTSAGMFSARILSAGAVSSPSTYSRLIYLGNGV
ncbi:hypothetical protein [Psychrobacillus psychrodurans]|uniref:hypothetical protein n=1 Tax=Psychrobacillus psychrodurans TaxID=126157 RepID=UPI0008E18E37|nr:hypothetical protein [Psychrobacillus psychrodurans]MCZ8541959.1 hypothetical protein [Psychrobacillus psychrodurans]SFN14103.1 hypothetical protein SAMN05421832_11657 [Psychrobacillus psychrodurans]